MPKRSLHRPNRRDFVRTLFAGIAGAGLSRRLIADPVAPESNRGRHLESIRGELSPLIRSALEQLDVPGLSLVVADRDRVLWCEGFGVSETESGRPVGPNTLFRAGSLAKPLTAAAVMSLVEAGVVDIDEPLDTYLPAFSIRTRQRTAGSEITVRGLLCHHAGVPTDLIKGMWTDSPLDDLLDALRHEYTAFAPGLVFSYSNLGYSLLGLMIQQVGGRPFEKVLGERILQPLSMTRTRFASLPGDDADRAPGHRDGFALDALPIRDLPACGLETCAIDLGNLLSAILCAGRYQGRQVLGPQCIEDMLEPQHVGNRLDLGLFTGLGWFLEEATLPGCGRVARHSGSTIGYAADLIMLPEEGLGAAVLANGDGALGLCSQLAEALLTRLLEGTVARPTSELFLDRLERPPGRTSLGDIAGHYATDLGLIALDPTAGTLCTCMSGTTVSLIDDGQGWYTIEPFRGTDRLPRAAAPLAQMRFQTRRIDGREVVVARRGERELVLGEKVPRGPLTDTWRGRAGAYLIDNADPGFPVVDVELILRNEGLCLRYRMPALSAAMIQVPVGPVSDREAVILGLGRTRGETLAFVETANGERLRYSGLIGRRVDAGS